MAFIEWPLFETPKKVPDIADAQAVLNYSYNAFDLGVFDNSGIGEGMQKYLGYTWVPTITSLTPVASQYSPVTSTGSVKFSNAIDGSTFVVKANISGSYLDANYNPSLNFPGAGKASYSIDFAGKNSANAIRQMLSESIQSSFDYREGYREDNLNANFSFKDGLDTRDKTDDIVSKVASTAYDLSSETETRLQATTVQKHSDSVDALYSKSAGTNQEIYQTLKIANEYSHVEKENSNGSSSENEFKSEILSSSDKDVSNKLSQTRDVSYAYSLNAATDVDGNVVSSESEDKSFKITYSDKYITNAFLAHVESSLDNVNDNAGVEATDVSDKFNLDYSDAGAHKFSIALQQKSDEVSHESGNSDSAIEVYDLSKFNYSDAVNSFAFSFKEVNSTGTTVNGDYKDDVYKLDVDVNLKTADYSITTKEITQQTLEDFTYIEVSQLYAGIARVTDYIDQLKNVDEFSVAEGNSSLFAEIGSVKFTDFSGALNYVSLLSDNTIKVLNQKGFETFAGRGDDAVIGNIGVDILHGGSGNDILTGGAGADAFVFETTLDAKNNVDIIKDFSHIQGDKILLDNLVFTGSQDFNTARFANAAAINNNTVAGVIYDNASGKLYYNADGIAGHTNLFATLNSHPVLAAQDIDFYAGAVI